MNYINQFIQLTVQEWKARLGITKPVIICTDKKEWIELFPQDKGMNLKKEAGGAQKNFNWIFLNLDLVDHKSLLELKNTIIHELLHIKHPEKSEEEIRKLTERYLELG